MSTRTLHRYPLLISVLLALTGLTVVGQIYIPIPILTEITQHFNNNKNMAGWVSSAFSIGYSAGFLLSGPLSDRFGRRLVMLTGFIFFLLFTVMVGFCSKYLFKMVGESKKLSPIFANFLIAKPKKHKKEGLSYGHRTTNSAQ